MVVDRLQEVRIGNRVRRMNVTGRYVMMVFRFPGESSDGKDVERRTVGNSSIPLRSCPNPCVWKVKIFVMFYKSMSKEMERRFKKPNPLWKKGKGHAGSWASGKHLTGEEC